MGVSKENAHGECPNGDKKVRRRGHASGGKRRSLKQFCNSQTKLRQNNSCAANCHQENRRGLNFHTFHDIRDDKNLLREEDKSKKRIQEVVLPPLEINEDKMERNHFYKEKQSKLPGISQMRNVQGPNLDPTPRPVPDSSNNRPRAPVDVEDEENRFELPRRINHTVNVPSPNFDLNFSNNRPSAPVYVQNEVDEEPTHMKSKNAKSSIRKIFFAWFRSKFL